MSNRKSRRHGAAIAITLMLIAAACSDDEGPSLEGNLITDGGGCSVTEVERGTEAPAIEAVDGADEWVTTEYEDLIPGDENGCTPDTSEFVTFDVIGATADGEVFLNTWERDDPMMVSPMENYIVGGLRSGTTGMQVGGRRLVKVPYQEGFSDTGDTTLGIGGEEALVFVVDLIAVTPEATVTCDPLVVDRNPDAPEGPADVAPVTELAVEELTEGDGCVADLNRYLTLDIAGYRADGSEFSTTWGQERPITARLSAGRLLPGIEQGIYGMEAGGRRQLTVPAELAYGSEGHADQEIGPDETVTFIVDLVGVTETPHYCMPPQPLPTPPDVVAGKPEAVDLPVLAVTELVTTDLVDGEGEPLAAGDSARLNYLGVSCFHGAQFDSSWDSGMPLDVVVGQGTIEGFGQGLVGMKVGGRRQVDIPADLAYGPQSPGADIGYNDSLTFIIEVLPPEEADGGEGDETAPGDTP